MGFHVEPWGRRVNSGAQPEPPRYWFKPPRAARNAASDSFIRHPQSLYPYWWSFRYVWFWFNRHFSEIYSIYVVIRVLWTAWKFHTFSGVELNRFFHFPKVKIFQNKISRTEEESDLSLFPSVLCNVRWKIYDTHLQPFESVVEIRHGIKFWIEIYSFVDDICTSTYLNKRTVRIYQSMFQFYEISLSWTWPAAKIYHDADYAVLLPSSKWLFRHLSLFFTPNPKLIINFLRFRFLL